MKKVIKQLQTKLAVALGLFLSGALANTAKADGVAGINAAGSELATYLDPLATLGLGIGACVGLIGGVRVFILWNSGERDINKELMGWFGSCIFLVLVSVVIKAFFV